MKGLSVSVVSALMIIIVIISAAFLYNQLNVVSTGAISEGTELLVSARIAPKLLGIACLDTYGYMILSSDNPMSGKIYYTVKYGLDEIASGFSDVSITDVGNVNFTATMTEDKEYTVKITARSWHIQENCISYIPS